VFEFRQGAPDPMIQAAGDLRSPRSDPGVPPATVDPLDRSQAPSWADRRLWDVVPIRDAIITTFIVAMVVLGAVLGYWLRSVVGPALVALITAYVCNPLIHSAEKRRVPRVVACAVLALLIAGVEVVSIFWLGPLLIKQTVNLTAEMPKVVGQIGDAVERRYDVDTKPITDPIEDLAPPPTTPGEPKKIDVQRGLRALQWAVGGDGGLAGTIVGVVGVASYVIGTAILFPIYVFLLAWHLPGTMRLLMFVPRRRRDEFVRILGLMNDAVSGFFRGRFVVSAIMAVLFAVGWWLCGVPYAVVLGVATGLLNIVPWASAVGWPLAVGLAYAEAAAGGGGVDWLRILVWPSFVYVLVQGLDGWVLTPWIQSRAVDLSAATVLIVVFLGGAAAGVPGLVLAVPIAACLKILFRELAMPRLRDWAERY
jgi:predicted PurR-regulated permease PerM